MFFLGLVDVAHDIVRGHIDYSNDCLSTVDQTGAPGDKWLAMLILLESGLNHSNDFVRHAEIRNMREYAW